MEIGFGKNRGCVDITSDGCFNDVDTVNKKGNKNINTNIKQIKHGTSLFKLFFTIMPPSLNYNSVKPSV